MKNIIILFTCLLMFSACEDWFDVSPKSNVKAEDMFSSESGFADVLTGAYTVLTTPDSYGTELSFGFVDVLARYYTSIPAQNHEYQNAISYSYKEQTELDRVASIWSTQYTVISNLNLMLSYIDEQKDVFRSEETFNFYKAEALGLRAMIHFDLLRLFGPSPKDGMDKLAIPYMIDYTNLAQAQLSVSETIDAVLEDIQTAKGLIKNIDYYGPNRANASNDEFKIDRQFKFNYYAMVAFEARVQLYAGNKANALDLAKEIVNTPDTEPIDIIELADGSNASDRIFKKEVLWGLEIESLSEDYTTYLTKNSNNLLATPYYLVDGLFMSANVADSEYRKGIWWTTLDYLDMASVKYAGNEGGKATMLPLIRVSEMYYIAAECATSEEEGFAYLNKMRQHRGLMPLVETGTLQQRISEEYKKEFLGEGQMFYYFKRHNSAVMGVFEDYPVGEENIYEIPLPTDELNFGQIEF
ncbi:RagB/SusD family nutrient uptake outer membrane protein [Marinifilum sp. RC60d5]|uniref:RagB/SusD family nutrient uptake outer membrane protein n=1 Tax=Marinifilum sp. RC60d5 TaxID=3458414 RepID=UPI004034FFFC